MPTTHTTDTQYALVWFNPGLTHVMTDHIGNAELRTVCGIRVTGRWRISRLYERRHAARNAVTCAGCKRALGVGGEAPA